MFDRLEDILIHFEEVMNELNEPTVTNNHTRCRSLPTKPDGIIALR